MLSFRTLCVSLSLSGTMEPSCSSRHSRLSKKPPLGFSALGGGGRPGGALRWYAGLSPCLFSDGESEPGTVGSSWLYSLELALPDLASFRLARCDTPIAMEAQEQC